MTSDVHYHRNTMQWEPEDGKAMFIKDIPMDHFVNIMNWILKNIKDYEKRSPGFYAFMEEEANYRKLLAFATGCQYPQKVGNQYILIGE